MAKLGILYLLYCVFISESTKCTVGFLLVNATVGIGIINLPEAYQQVDNLALAISIHCIICGCSFISMFIVAYASDKTQRSSYQDIMFDFYGEKGRALTSVFIFVSIYLYCTSLMVLIGDQIEEFTIFLDHNFYCNHHVWYTRREFVTVIIMIILLPFCFHKFINYLKYISTVGTAAFLYVSLLVFVKYTQTHSPSSPVKTPHERSKAIIYFIIDVLVCYEAQVSSVPIYSSMKHRNLRSYTKVLCGAFALATFFYMLMGVFGSLSFGSEVHSDILLSYKNPDVPVLIAVILLAVKGISSYTIIFFPGRSAVRSLWCQYWKFSDEETERKENIHTIVITSFWIASNTLMAMLLSNIRYFISFLGPFASTLTFILPAICLYRYTKDRGNKKEWKYNATIGLSIFFIISGLCFIGLSVIVMVFEYQNGESKSVSCETLSNVTYH
ncbi:putative sodium-coupled neutral amino acid transporter 7 [Octopus sinensis]|uniref:Sodium-coupled neutral amino acid transporter 7 n=1 Tax=Octopus sinensis TaxID=2607531 RepID=A0A7E6EJC5_9MOLL|nr:putative sodium-coupled neutral amino acid transporter 7 [Octopus sinensis]